MRKTISIIEACEVYGMLQQAKVTKVESKDKFKIISLTCRLRREAQAFEELRRETFNKLKADNHEQMTGDKAYISDLTRQMQECMADYLRQEVDFDALPDSVVEALIDSNDWTLGEACKIKEALT